MDSYNSYSLEHTSAQNKFISATYGWMAIALFISAISSVATASFLGLQLSNVTSQGGYYHVLNSFQTMMFVFCIAELALVWWLSASIRKMSVSSARIGYVIYSILSGITMSSIFFVYDLGSIGTIFFSTAIMFGIMAFYGARTKSDLRKAGKYLMMGLIGIIVASMVNMVITMFTHTVSPLTWLISIATVVIFAGLTAYDTQKILAISRNATNEDAYKKIAIIGALELYLDFINMFLALLRLFGKRRR
ncbi:MAG: Bax inhibitor-1/YccA family protein [Treponema sp.]|nr:Bax inhibitor-1/YccA family protein [Treponema sp.]